MHTSWEHSSPKELHSKREPIKSTRKCISLVPRVLDHSNNDIKYNVFNSITKTYTPLNMWLFLPSILTHTKCNALNF